MHFEPDNCFLASGLWFPPSPQLKALREQIVARSNDFLRIEADLKKAGLEFGTEHMLTRLPNAFKNEENADVQRLLKYKMFIVSKPFEEDRAFSPDFVDDVVSFGKTVLPLMNFVWRATDTLREEDGNA